MASQPRSVSPKAGACIALGWSFSEGFPAHRCLAYTGFISGLTLGMALSHIDPDWTREAYDELAAQQDAIWGKSDAQPHYKRLEAWKEAQALIRTSRLGRHHRDGDERSP